MMLDPMFKTKTMARILAAQGQMTQAAEIYTSVLTNGGCREAMISDSTTAKDLISLYEKWVRLAFDYGRKTRNR
ncbi:MAG: hypothetical protein R6U50_12135 [Desulfobacterales bacterium]